MIHTRKVFRNTLKYSSIQEEQLIDDKLLYDFANKSSKKLWEEANSRRDKQFLGDIVIDGCDDMNTNSELFRLRFSSAT